VTPTALHTNQNPKPEAVMEETLIENS